MRRTRRSKRIASVTESEVSVSDLENMRPLHQSTPFKMINNIMSTSRNNHENNSSHSIKTMKKDGAAIEFVPHYVTDVSKEKCDLIEISYESSDDSSEYQIQLENADGIDVGRSDSLKVQVDETSWESNLEARKIDTCGIDIKSWQWQPNIKLSRIDPNDFIARRKANRKDFESPKSKFDPERSFIQELSPKSGQKRLKKRMEEMKHVVQRILMEPSDVNRKRPRIKKVPSEQQLEYEEIHRRLQQKKPKKRSKRPQGRRLYTPNDDSMVIENSDVESTQKRARILLPSTRIRLKRGKQSNSTIN